MTLTTTRIGSDWPCQVKAPGSYDWERSAAKWLRELVPARYASYPALLRHPVLLARFAAGHVAAGVNAAREGLRTARAELRDLLPPEAVEAALAAYDREGRRLVRAGREVALVDAALRGERHVPRL